MNTFAKKIYVLIIFKFSYENIKENSEGQGGPRLKENFKPVFFMAAVT